MSLHRPPADFDNTNSTLLMASNAPTRYGGGARSGADSPGSSVFDLPVQYHTGIPSTQSPSQQSLSSQDTHSNTSLTDTEKHREPGPSYLVISGGSGGNAICSAFGDACYVLPVSDDGGSSSEIIRVLGGPSIGDIRSRLIRLIPPSPQDSPLDRIRQLLAYRLSAEALESEARNEWRDIIEGRSPLWNGIPMDRKEVIRGFLVHFESEILRRAQRNFTFRNGSIGNYFLSAACLFFRSLPSAIFLFSSITKSQAMILPVLITSHTVTIAAELENGRTIVGQCNISHPVDSEYSCSLVPLFTLNGMDEYHESQAELNEHSNLPNIFFSKNEEKPLEARISRIFYINPYGHEVRPSPNSDYIAQLSGRDILVYSCGSLWTSIMPCLALRGVAAAIARSHTLKAKVLLLNSENDRETGGYTATDYIVAISRMLNTHYEPEKPHTTYPISAFITHLVYLRNGTVPLDIMEITELGVRCVEVESHDNSKGVPRYDADSVHTAMQIILREQQLSCGTTD